MNEIKSVSGHSFRYENGKIYATGVVSVEEFDDKEAVLRLSDSVLTLKGSGFVLVETEVKSGLFSMEGKITSLSYHAKEAKIGFVKRLFK